MIRKIQRKQFLSSNPSFPQSNYRTDKYIFPKTYDSYLFTIESKSAKGHAKLLSKEFCKLMKLMGFDKIRFLTDTSIPWLFRDHDYKPVHEALNYLKENKIGKTFNGVLEVDITSLPEFLKNLYWLVRGNGIVNYVHFGDVSNNIIVSFCQYGSVHFSTLSSETDEVFENKIGNTKFKFISDGNCIDPFSKTSAIKHRRAAL
jgi:hypothetical protein